MKQHKYFITGASGFIGGALLNSLNDQRASVIGVGRSDILKKNYFQSDIFNNARLRELLKGATCIVHCAGYAHAFDVAASKGVGANWRINYEGTKNLINLAAEQGVKTFIHLSSVKVMGGVGKLCVDESWDYPPETDYGKSKLAAERVATNVGIQFGIRVINLRLAMVYGAGGKGNLERMAQYVSQNIFPPLPETNNHRSMVHIQDVIQAILCASESDQLESDCYIVTGPDAPSGRQLYDHLRKVYGMTPVKMQVPRNFLEHFASICELAQRVFRRKLPFNHEVLGRLLDSEWYSSNKFAAKINWRPSVGLEMGLIEMARDPKIHLSNLD